MTGAEQDGPEPQPGAAADVYRSTARRDIERPPTAEQWGERLAELLIGNEFDVVQDHSQTPGGAEITATTLEKVVDPMSRDDKDLVRRVRVAAGFAGFRDALTPVELSSSDGLTVLQLTYFHPTTQEFPGARARIQQLAQERAGATAAQLPGKA